MKKLLTFSVLLLLVAGLTTGCVLQSGVSPSGVSTEGWKTFDSQKDAGLKTKVTFNYPENWSVTETTGRDDFLEVSFFDEQKTSVAYMGFIQGAISKNEKSDGALVEEIKVNGIVSKKVVEVEKMTGEKRAVLLVPYDDESELFFLFQMLVPDDEEMEVFEEIVKSIKF